MEVLGDGQGQVIGLAARPRGRGSRPSLPSRSSRSRGRRRRPARRRSPRARSGRRRRSTGRRCARSKRNRHGLRRPVSQISWRAPSVSTNGLSAGIVYCGSTPGLRASMSMRRILASERIEVAAGIERIAAATAVAGRDVEVALRPERQAAAVVVAELVGHAQDDHLAVGVGAVAVVGHRLVRGHDLARRRAPCSRRRTADRSRSGWNARPSRPCSPPAVTIPPISRSGVSTEAAVAHDPDAAALLDDEQAGWIVRPPGDIDRLAEATGDRLEGQGRCLEVGARGSRSAGRRSVMAGWTPGLRSAVHAGARLDRRRAAAGDGDRERGREQPHWTGADGAWREGYRDTRQRAQRPRPLLRSGPGG